MLNEVWKTVPEFPNYQVSNTGLVKGKTGKVLKTFIQNGGYEVATMHNESKRSVKRTVHRLVAELHIPNPEDKPIVNHLDGNKLNNHSSNLEWCDNSRNILHAREIGLNPYNKPTVGKKLPPRGNALTSKYYGVSWDKARNQWKVRIQHNGKVLPQKRFNDEREAAKFYNLLVQEYQLDRPLNLLYF